MWEGETFHRKFMLHKGVAVEVAVAGVETGGKIKEMGAQVEATCEVFSATSEVYRLMSHLMSGYAMRKLG